MSTEDAHGRAGKGGRSEYKEGMNSRSKWQHVMIDLMWGKERLFKSMPR